MSFPRDFLYFSPNYLFIYKQFGSFFYSLMRSCTFWEKSFLRYKLIPVFIMLSVLWGFSQEVRAMGGPLPKTEETEETPRGAASVPEEDLKAEEQEALNAENSIDSMELENEKPPILDHGETSSSDEIFADKPSSEPFLDSSKETSRESLQSRGPRSRYELRTHPLASKGLERIDLDGAFYYKARTGIKKEAAGVKLGSIQPPSIESSNGRDNFQTVYGGGGISSAQIDYEWQPFTKWGKLGLQLGVGVYMSQGQGRFSDGSAALEEYTFVALPLTVGVAYRLEWMEDQWFAPYLGAGVGYTLLGEIRDDGDANNSAGAPTAYGLGGVLLGISRWNRDTAFALWGEYGIASMWLSLEYRVSKSFSKELDLSSNTLFAGLVFDF